MSILALAMSATTIMAQFVPRIRPDLIARRRPPWRAPMCVHEARRTFAIHHRNQAKAGVGQKMGMMAQRGQPSQQAVKLQMKKGMKGLKDASKIPDDMGLLPDTFIMPTGKNLPSLFNDTKFRLQLEWTRAKRRFTDYFSSILAYRWQIYSGMPAGVPRPPKPTINIRTIVPAATKLHKQMYTAYAKGDVKVLQEICTESVRQHYLTKIAKRVEDREKMTWELVSYKAKPRLCSMKAGGTPIELKGIPIGIQQAVVKIRSLQRLKMGTMTGARVTGSKATEKEHVVWKEPKEKEVTEYIVVQRRLIEGKYEPWKAWGFVKELDVAAEKKKNREVLKAQETTVSEGGITTPR